MTRYVLKYNRYSKQRVAVSQDDTAALLVRVSLAVILLFLAVYIIENNSLMLSERMIKLEERKILVAEKNTSELEIEVARKAASYNLKDVASQRDMVLSAKVSYVSVEGDAVALAR